MGLGERPGTIDTECLKGTAGEEESKGREVENLVFSRKDQRIELAEGCAMVSPENCDHLLKVGA